MSNPSLRKIIFGENVLKLREKNDMSQQDLARDIGQIRQTIHNWEKGKNLPAVKTLIEVADYFGVTIDNILFNPDLDGKSSTVRIGKLEHDLNEVKNALSNLEIFEKSLKKPSGKKLKPKNTNT